MMFTKKENKVITPLPLAKVMKECPNVFNSEPVEAASEKYVPVNVFNEIVRPLNRHGWFIRDVRTPRSKKGAKSMFMLRLANKRYETEERATEIVITSSHDRTSALTFKMGVLELVCSNGLVVMTDSVKELANIRILHKGDVADKLSHVLRIIESETLAVEGIFENMKDRTLTVSEQQQLAITGLELHGVTAKKGFEKDVAIRTALQTSIDAKGERIKSQNGDDLFNTFQRIQGNIMKGQVQYRTLKSYNKMLDQYDFAKFKNNLEMAQKLEERIAEVEAVGGQFRKLTALTNIKAEQKFNEKLFAAAVEML